jgi:hypothetical protein
MLTQAQPVTKRKPRFRRAPEGHIQLTERDIEILLAVFRHRFLRSTHLTALVGGGQGLIRRLGLLYHHHFLDRPREQIEFYQYAGSKPMVYAIGNRGADLLAEAFAVPRGKIDWTSKNRDIGPIFLDHTLLVADVMVAFEAACQKSGRVRLIRADEILKGAPEVTRRRKNPLKWNVPASHRGQNIMLGLVPDKIFGLQYLDKPEGKNRAYFFLEADRATMPVMRSDIRQTSFYRKMVGYHETWKQGLHTKVYGIKNFRVLTVTSSPQRVKNLIEANKQLADGQGSRMFLFTHEKALQALGDPLALGWLNGRDNQAVRLVE